MASPEELENDAERCASFESLSATPHIAPHHGKQLALISQEPIEFCGIFEGVRRRAALGPEQYRFSLHRLLP